MPPKFGNYLFRNLQDQSGKDADITPVPMDAPALEDRVIILGEADFVAKEALTPVLAWDRHPGRTVEIRLRDTCGLTDGQVTIQVGVLRRVANDLVPASLPDELPLPLSLKSVVMQIHPYLGQPKGDIPRSPGPDYDTPIAQVAREDEGFFGLEPMKRAAPGSAASQAVEPSTPTLPLIREKPAVADSPPNIVVSGPRPTPALLAAHPVPLPESTEDRLAHLFTDVPAVGPRSRPTEPGLPQPMPDLPVAPPQPQQEGNDAAPMSVSHPSTPSLKPLKRVALERLQEVFMTEDLLDIGQVLRLVGTFPKVAHAFAVTADGDVHGENSSIFGTKLTHVPALLKAVREFADSLGINQPQGLTLQGDSPVSVIGRDGCVLVVFHTSRNLPPGMKDRLALVAAALADLLVDETPRT